MRVELKWKGAKSQVPVSRIIGKVRTGTHMDGNRVYQALRRRKSSSSYNGRVEVPVKLNCRGLDGTVD